MFSVITDFAGANAIVEKIEGNTVFLKPDLRDTDGDWFYWAFRVDGAGGQTVRFVFDSDIRIGYYGPAVSHDYKTWHWLDETNYYKGNSFSYTFSDEEKSVYFAHDMLYRPEQFFDFARSINLDYSTLCLSRKGREIPCFTLGCGTKHIILTARHHACESTGSYVLEGLIHYLVENPIDNCTFFCVPIVDFDGVTDGDQGKNRKPHDHAREYDFSKAAIYPETEKIREYIEANPILMCCDFHSPWHYGDVNDKVFIPMQSFEKLDLLQKFSQCLEQSITPDSLKYRAADNMMPDEDWNKAGLAAISKPGLEKSESSIGFTLETCYYGTKDNIFSPQKAKALGKCFGVALKKYLSEF